MGASRPVDPRTDNDRTRQESLLPEQLEGESVSPHPPANDADATRVPASGETGGWWSLAIVGIVLSVAQMGFFLTAAALPLYLHDLGAAPDRIGLEVGLGNITSLAITLVLGPALNRYGPGVFLRLGAGVYLISALGMAVTSREAPAAGLRGLQGLGNAMLMPAGSTLATRIFPDRQATALAMVGLLNNLSLALGPPLGLWLYATHGAQGLFVPAAGAALLGLLATAFLPTSPQLHLPAPGFGFDRSWWPALFANMLQAAYFGGILAYLPLMLQRVHGPNAGIFFTADAIGVLALRIPTGLLADRAGSLVPKLVGLVVTIPGILVLALAPSIATLAIAGACTGIGAGFLVTAILADLSHSSTSANRGTAMSLGSASFSAGIFLGSAISGVLIGPGGWNAIIIFGTLTTLSTFPFALAASRAVPRS